MPVLSLKQLAYKRIENPAFYKKLKSLGRCPFDLLEPILRQMTYFQLLVLEDNTPRLVNFTQPVWKMHTLKVFPSIVDTHDIECEEAEDADWRLVFQELQEERREREQAARDKLKANYSQIASGKSDRKIQVIRKETPTRSQLRASANRSSLGLPSRGPSSIMNKAVKASLGSNSRTFSAANKSPSVSSVAGRAIRPNPNARTSSSNGSPAHPGSHAQRSLPTRSQPSPISKFLKPTIKKK